MNMPETYESLNEHPPTSNVQRMTLIPFVNSQVVEQVNNEIHSGENYRIYNGAMTNFNSRMKIYDEIILGSADTLQKLYHHNLSSDEIVEETRLSLLGKNHIRQKVSLH